MELKYLLEQRRKGKLLFSTESESWAALIENILPGRVLDPLLHCSPLARITSTSSLFFRSHIDSWMSPRVGAANTCLPTSCPGPNPSMNSFNWPPPDPPPPPPELVPPLPPLSPLSVTPRFLVPRLLRKTDTKNKMLENNIGNSQSNYFIWLERYLMQYRHKVPKAMRNYRPNIFSIWRVIRKQIMTMGGFINRKYIYIRGFNLRLSRSTM